MTYDLRHLSSSTGKKTATGKTYQQPISQGQFYTLISRAESCDKVLLLNFDPEKIKVNKSALEEMVRMRQESVFSWQHPLTSFNGTTKHRACNAHLTQFLSGNICQSYSSLFCFIETNINDSPVIHID